MIFFWFAVVTLAVFAAGLVWSRRRAASAVFEVPEPTRPKAPLQKPAARHQAPAHAGFDWEEPILAIEKTPDPAAVAPGSAAPVIELRGAQRRKLRDRYLAARFPGVARTGADLQHTERVIQAARLYFEDRKLDRAIELLGLAIRTNPAEEGLALARLEIAFLLRDPALYVALAAEFRAAHPSSKQWPEVARLGRAIAPDEAMFGSGGGTRAGDHYGPWPDMPNWMHAPWDLTAEVRATEFHQAMARRAA